MHHTRARDCASDNRIACSKRQPLHVRGVAVTRLEFAVSAEASPSTVKPHKSTFNFSLNLICCASRSRCILLHSFIDAKMRDALPFGVLGALDNGDATIMLLSHTDR